MATAAKVESPVVVEESAGGKSLKVRGEPGARVPVVAAEPGGKPSTTALIMVALEKGTPVEQLAQLMDLHERVEARDAAKAYVRDMAAVKAELPPIIHTKKVDFTTSKGSNAKYSYTELDELARIIDPILAKHGFSYNWSMKLDKGMVTTTCTVWHIDGHSRSAEFTVPAESNSAASPQQKVGIADTYAARRSLIAALGLTTADKDPRPAEVDPTPITEDQATVLGDLIAETKIDRAAFLNWLDTESLETLPAIRYQQALSALKQKKRGAK